MLEQDLSILEIHKLSQEQYDKALAAGNINANALYLTPDDEEYMTSEQVTKAINDASTSVKTHVASYYTQKYVWSNSMYRDGTAQHILEFTEDSEGQYGLVALLTLTQINNKQECVGSLGTYLFNIVNQTTATIQQINPPTILEETDTLSLNILYMTDYNFDENEPSVLLTAMYSSEIARDNIQVQYTMTPLYRATQFGMMYCETYTPLDASRTYTSLASVISNNNTLIEEANDYTDEKINDLSTVAKTGSYNDLTDKPSIEEEQEDGSKALEIADKDGNVIVRIDAEGLTTTNITANNITNMKRWQSYLYLPDSQESDVENVLVEIQGAGIGLLTLGCGDLHFTYCISSDGADSVVINQIGSTNPGYDFTRFELYAYEIDGQDIEIQGFDGSYPLLANHLYLTLNSINDIPIINHITGDNDASHNTILNCSYIPLSGELSLVSPDETLGMDLINDEISLVLNYDAYTDRLYEAGSCSSKTNAIIAASFIGELLGTANKANNDGNGNKIDTTYLKVSEAIGKAGSGTGAEIFNSYTENTASGNYSQAQGYNTAAAGDYSNAQGYNTTAHDYQLVIGHTNSELTGGNYQNINGAAFIIGNGVSASMSNAFYVNFDGTGYTAGSTISSGADYAEYFEWEDGNFFDEDRRGYFVTISGDKIRKATSYDYILGVVSGAPSVIGNGDIDWAGRYVLDEFGSRIKETFEYEEEVVDKETGEITTVVTTGVRYKENPNYDASRPYIQRADRPEWDAVGMLGVLAVRDDGTCVVNGYCTVTDEGTATAAGYGYRVIARVTDNVIKIILK